MIFRKMGSSVLNHSMLLLISLLFVIPFVWLVLTSLKPEAQVFTDPLQWIPQPFQWSNYRDALTHPSFPFFRLLSNTLFYAGTSTIGIVYSSALVAYGFSRIKFWGRDILFLITISTMLLPAAVMLIPRYVLFFNLGWVGSYAPLIVPHFLGNAFNIFLLRQFMLSVPWELSDAARIDGANEFVIFQKIVLPLVRPALIVVAIFHFMFTWNDFFEPLIYLNDPEQYTLVLGLYAFQTNRARIVWSLMMAAAVTVTIPLIGLFFAAQRYFVEGISLTGSK